ncbi:ABC transporter substrate-binding protein [Kineosporia sp. R_H_3]|uniref:ABC transporter substrate-binding protein n=1 Tax=Kineosporia sp. R_H_3 TaxID=1961848 RepID=UPI000B4ABE8B|nr:ABC transporter substrate-binding protein [Kineosporia sp. R_H_3]
MTARREYDAIRRAANPLQLDLIESFVAGRLPRREFVRMGLLLGMTGATIAACGGANSIPTSTGSAGQTTGVGVGGGTAGAVKTGGTMKIASVPPAGPLDSVKMVDLAAYGLVAQCYEFLVYTSGDLQLKPGLATEWKPNADATEWTFTLRQGVTWQKDGAPLTADDVISTFDRLSAAGNSALKGVIDKGSVTSPDGKTVVFKLNGPNGNFPYLVSPDNAQSPIIPKSQADGATLDKEQNGTGPWKITKFDAKTGATFVRNDKWWGTKTPLDSVEWVFFSDLQPQVVALQSGQVDAIVQFQANGGEALLNNSNLTVISLKSANHRQVWMRTDKGAFKDPQVREALAWTLDRDAMVKSLWKGTADVAADTVIAPVYPFADPSLPARTQDIDKAKALLASAGATNLKATLHAVKLQEIPDLATLIKSDAAKAGITLDIQVEDGSTFYGKQWCPEKPADPPCSGASDLGIVDYGHRGTPDVYLNAALSGGGVWNSSQYNSKDFDAAFKAYQASIGVDAQKAACRKISDIMQKDTPILVPYFYQYLAAHSTKYVGMATTALGQVDLTACGLKA